MIYEEVFRTFNEMEVKYLVGGGLAVNLHGAPRGTYDLDLFLKMTEGNIKKAIGELLDLDYRPRLPVDPFEFAKSSVREQWIESKNMNAFTFHHKEHELHAVDLLFNLCLDFENCLESAVLITAGSLEIPIVSIDDLITLKKDANRDVDKLDVSMLEKLQELDHE